MERALALFRGPR